MNTYITNYTFAEAHMPDIKRELLNLPANTFLTIINATPQKDMTQATDLILAVACNGDIAVRIRRKKHYEYALKYNQFDWSIRYTNKGYKTEIDKLREGFAKWYFMGWSLDDISRVGRWYLLDCDKIRSAKMLDRKWTINPNGDGTSAMYIPISALMLENCVVNV